MSVFAIIQFSPHPEVLPPVNVGLLVYDGVAQVAFDPSFPRLHDAAPGFPRKLLEAALLSSRHRVGDMTSEEARTSFAKRSGQFLVSEYRAIPSEISAEVLLDAFVGRPTYPLLITLNMGISVPGQTIIVKALASALGREKNGEIILTGVRPQRIVAKGPDFQSAAHAFERLVERKLCDDAQVVDSSEEFERCVHALFDPPDSLSARRWEMARRSVRSGGVTASGIGIEPNPAGPGVRIHFDPPAGTRDWPSQKRVDCSTQDADEDRAGLGDIELAG